MSSNLKLFATDAMTYGIGELLTRSTQFLIIPLIFVFLSPEQFGKLDYFLSAKLLLTTTLGWGILTALLRFKTDDSGIDFGEVVFNSLSLILTINTIIFFCVYYFTDNISQFLLGGIFNKEFLITYLISFFYALRTIPQGLQRLNHKPKQFLMANVIDVVLYILISFLLLKFTNLGYFSILVANLISVICSLIGSWSLNDKLLVFRWNTKLQKQIFIFGLSILSTSFTFIWLQSAQRIFLKMNAGFEDLSLLGIATRFSVVVGAFVIAPFNLAWLPYVNQIFKNENFEETVQSIYQIVVFLCFELIVIVTFFTYDFLIITKQEFYLNAVVLVPVLSSAYLFLGLYYIWGAGIYLSKKTSQYFYLSLFTLVINLSLHFILIRQLTPMLITIINLISHLSLFFGAFFFGRGIIKIKLFTKEIILSLLLALISGFLFFIPLYLKFSIYPQIIIHCLITILLPVRLILSGSIKREIAFSQLRNLRKKLSL